MQVYVDESGDPGFKKGASRHFTVALVVVHNEAHAEAIRQAAARVRARLRLPKTFEFHFNGNSDRYRLEYLRELAACEFEAHICVVDKHQLDARQYPKKEKLYDYVCGLVFQQAQDILRDAAVLIDRSGDRAFEQQLTTYLRRLLNQDGPEGKKLKSLGSAESDGNDLIQLADMVCGAVARSFRDDRKETQAYRKIIAHRIKTVRLSPGQAAEE